MTPALARYRARNTYSAAQERVADGLFVLLFRFKPPESETGRGTTVPCPKIKLHLRGCF